MPMSMLKWMLPLLLVLMGFTESSGAPRAVDKSKDGRFVVVIDPGHGGHDSGAVGEYAKEKNINLAVGRKLAEKINEKFNSCGAVVKSNSPASDAVNVVMTRSTDVFIPLQKRCEIANRANGDLFISIHVNSVDAKSPYRSSARGASVYTLGLDRSQQNFEVAKRENAVMMLEDDYTTTYCGFDPNSTESYIMFEMTQNRHMNQSIKFASMVQQELVSTAHRADKGVRQDIFWVLVHTGMPAVLVELDFICNPDSESYLTSDTGVDEMATAIYNAFADYHRSEMQKRQLSN